MVGARCSQKKLRQLKVLYRTSHPSSQHAPSDLNFCAAKTKQGCNSCHYHGRKSSSLWSFGLTMVRIGISRTPSLLRGTMAFDLERTKAENTVTLITA